MGSGDADPTLHSSLGKKGCPPQVFRVLYTELPFHKLFYLTGEIIYQI